MDRAASRKSARAGSMIFQKMSGERWENITATCREYIERCFALVSSRSKVMTVTRWSSSTRSVQIIIVRF